MGELKWEHRYYKTGRAGELGVTIESHRIVLYEILDPVNWQKARTLWEASHNNGRGFPLRKNDKRIRIWKEWIVSRGSTQGPKSQWGRAQAEAMGLVEGGLFYTRLRLGKPGQIVDYRVKRKGE